MGDQQGGRAARLTVTAEQVEDGDVEGGGGFVGEQQGGGTGQGCRDTGAPAQTAAELMRAGAGPPGRADVCWMVAACIRGLQGSGSGRTALPA
ncbi:hypothetical protein [Streptomyces atratus]|uniref:hypothetical protein n=1 Tax=Streptomyces atratus TaxID=1893 RepID=UPI00364E4226